MAVPPKNPVASEVDLWPEIEAALWEEDDTAAGEHLAAGFPIYYSEPDTPGEVAIKEYSDGHRELVRFDHDGEHLVSAIA